MLLLIRIIDVVGAGVAEVVVATVVEEEVVGIIRTKIRIRIRMILTLG